MPRKPKRNCEQNPYEKGTHVQDLKELAQKSIESFFDKKSWFIGGPIPQKILFSEDSIKTVLRTPFDDETFKFIHNKCLTTVKKPFSYTEKTVPWSVTFLIKLINEMKSLGLPKELQPGLLLLYFEFCKGVKVLIPAL